MLLDELLLPPNKEQIKAIKADLKEDEERFENNLKLLTEWLEAESHLPKNYEKNMLPIYLRGCKHDLEKTKRKLEMYFVCKTKMNELTLRDFKEDDVPIIKNTVALPMPKLTPDGSRLLIIKVRDSNIDLFDLFKMIPLGSKLVHLRLCKETMYSGMIYILDADNIKNMHASKLVFSVLKKAAFLGQEVFAFRVKQVILINAPSYIEKIVNTLKLLLKPKIRERFTIDKGMSCLKNAFPKECMPSDYGGSELSIDVLMDKWLDCFEEQKKWFDYWETVKLIGPVPKKYNENMFDDNIGVQSSFRQLNLD